MHKKKVLPRLKTGNCRLFIWVLPAALAVMIFLFSAQPGDESAALSNGILYQIYRVLAVVRPSLDDQQFLEAMSVVIRKAAHITEYLLLYLSFFLSWRITGFGRLLSAPVSLLCTFGYAASDEFHQLFVSGRNGCFTDVLIDVSGGALVCLFLLCCCRMRDADAAP